MPFLQLEKEESNDQNLLLFGPNLYRVKKNNKLTHDTTNDLHCYPSGWNIDYPSFYLSAYKWQCLISKVDFIS